MRLNTAVNFTVKTHEGGRAFSHLKPIERLRRSVASCLLWERQFYEDGQDIATRIYETALQVSPDDLANLAIEAREAFNLRHAPLLLLHALAQTAKGTPLAGDTIPKVIQRADELAEFLAVYWREGKRPLAKQVKRGLAEAFTKFDEYALAKYNRDNAIKLRDVLFLVHAKPKDEAQAALWKRLVDGELASPDTWEVALSGGADKRETFERLLREEKLGYLALLRNLRNMAEAGVDTGLVRNALLARKGARRVLPFRYVAAARAAPQFEPFIDEALSEAVSDMPPLSGKTIVLVDVSGSMNNRLSAKSDLTRMDAAAALASVIHGDLRVFSFSARGLQYGGFNWNRGGYEYRHDGSNVLVEVPPRRGMAGIDAVIRSQEHGGTMLGKAVQEANALPHDRLIVVTDEQSHDPVPDPVAKKAYMINVASAKNGVGYGKWTHIDGFSESVLRFIEAHERQRA